MLEELLLYSYTPLSLDSEIGIIRSMMFLCAGTGLGHIWLCSNTMNRGNHEYFSH